MLKPFPADWQSMLVLMPHPDDPEYGMSAAVAKWTAAGKTVRYVMATRGEAGIKVMSPDQTAAVRQAEQRRAAEIVGVIAEMQPDVVVTIFGGPEWVPGAPNQRDRDRGRLRRRCGQFPCVTREVPVRAQPGHPGARAGAQASRHDDAAAPDLGGRRIVEFILCE